ncbi:MAG: chorismate-binding protein [Actinomycetota bacterium]|nr:chorismate-binding protein [Actinomycetota bacterium]
MKGKAIIQEDEVDAGLRIYPSEQEFQEIGDFDMALVFAEVSSDLETPISAFLKLRGEGSCFLLESAESEQMWGRYSFLGFEPMAHLSCDAGTVLLKDGSGSRELGGNPVRSIFEMVESSRVFIPGDMNFAGGAVGYFSYDILPYIENVKFKDGASIVPEMQFIFPRIVLMFDHLRSRLRLCVLEKVGRNKRERKSNHERSVLDISRLAAQLSKPLPEGMGIRFDENRDAAEERKRPDVSGGLRENEVKEDEFKQASSNVSRGSFESMVKKAKEYIYAGDAFQVVVSQRFSLEAPSDPFLIYRYLRAENPSPYMFYFELDDITLIGASPEAMVTRRGERAIIRPIAGTRPRGSSPEEDALLKAELASDEKERAEHVMLVDLARNDLGRVSHPGTVRVKSLMEIEKYSHVMHMVSEVEGIISRDCGNYELLCAAFPAGTVIGAPKVRASEIVDELEPQRRGPYAGAIGYISYNGDMDTCIAIRTVMVRGGTAHLQAGAGIVADSVPESEYEESKNKARVLLRSINAARQSFRS